MKTACFSILIAGGLLLMAGCPARDRASEHDSRAAPPATTSTNEDKSPATRAKLFEKQDDDDIRRRTREIVSRQLGISKTQLNNDTPLSLPPITADELDMIELIMELEVEYDVVIEGELIIGDDQALKPLSVNDLVEIVSTLTRDKGSKAFSDEPAPTVRTPAEARDGQHASAAPPGGAVDTDRPQPTAPYRRLKVTKVNDVTAVVFVDRILRDEVDVYELGQELSRLVAGQHSVRILLDLREVEAVSDVALGKLLMFQDKIEATSGQVKLSGLRPEVLELFKVTRLDQVFAIYDTRAGGLAAFQGSEKKIMVPSHFSSIGFAGETAEELLALANRVANDADAIEVPEGKYLRWSSSCGAEVWLQLDGDNELIGVVPHFAGESRVRVGITARVTRPDETRLDGAFHGYANPGDDSPESGDYPFVFDLPDYRRHSGLTIPTIVTAQIAAFAHEVSFFDSSESFEASQTTELPLASKSFIPSGLFEPGGAPIEPPLAQAILSGHVLKSARKVNELSGQAYYWALVESMGGTFDVVIHERLVAETPRAGSVVTGLFWLSGRLRTAVGEAAPEG